MNVDTDQMYLDNMSIRRIIQTLGNNLKLILNNYNDNPVIEFSKVQWLADNYFKA